MKNNKIGYYDYTVILTYLGMFSACIGIFQIMEQRYCQSVLCLMAAGLCDMFDGAVASTKERNKYEKLFGIQIDSLSDLISFGVLPGLFTYQICKKNIVSGFICAVYILAALIRLAYFNVLEEYRQAETPEKCSEFLGIPVTTIAVLLPVIYVLYYNDILKSTACFLILLSLTGTGFLTPVKIKKPDIAGKIILIIVGIIEAIGVILFMGWDAI